MTWQTVPLGELMPSKIPSVDPAKHPEEVFELWSIPAYDAGTPEVLKGSEIGSSKKCVEPSDVLLSRIVPHIRRSCVVEPVGNHRQIASGEWITFRSARLHPPYLRQLLVSDFFHVQLMQTVAGVGGSLLRARPEGVKKIEIPLPPLEEQRRIAAILDAADALRAKRRAALAKLDTLAQSIFVEMFGEWDKPGSKCSTVMLGDKLDFLTSGSRGWAQHYADEGALFLRVQNVRNDVLDLSDIAFVNAPSTAEAKRTHVEPGDVLLSITADLGRTAVVPSDIGEAYINQHLAILRTSQFDPRFLSAALTSPTGQRGILKRNRAAVKAGLNFDDVRSVVLPDVPMKSQREFAERASKVDFLKQPQRKSLEDMDALFASLQHRAFRGELTAADEKVAAA